MAEETLESIAQTGIFLEKFNPDFFKEQYQSHKRIEQAIQRYGQNPQKAISEFNTVYFGKEIPEEFKSLSPEELRNLMNEVYMANQSQLEKYVKENLEKIVEEIDKQKLPEVILSLRPLGNSGLESEINKIYQEIDKITSNPEDTLKEYIETISPMYRDLILGLGERLVKARVEVLVSRVLEYFKEGRELDLSKIRNYFEQILESSNKIIEETNEKQKPVIESLQNQSDDSEREKLLEELQNLQKDEQYQQAQNNLGLIYEKLPEVLYQSIIDKEQAEKAEEERKKKILQLEEGKIISGFGDKSERIAA